MIYCYRHPDGRIIEESFPIGSAPPVLIFEGVECNRDFGAENKGTNDAECRFDGKYPYVSKRLPKNMPGCPTDKKGFSVVVSKAHERELCARYNYSRE